METLARLCEALELELLVCPRGQQSNHEAHLAREQERARRLDRRRRHAVLAVRLLTARSATRAALVRRARRQVDLWERDALCSRHYIVRWRKRLSGPVGRVATALVAYDDWTDALFQNSPWAFALEPAVP
jgi:hypothetical protein